ncbi:ubiquitin carboxyl-terminal hydrolase 47-like [Parambassis ranga]|uniref:Ubiquitin carboxyl-terminal hydrolase 47-like n=1 Tax=Parambassis ranga TaxID=210632 RepID=A0A6P7K7M2_9TELE|nr:ubiquitin carboxyl-terminal hydrolase 47-like [Parambassis ranga]
MNHQVVNTFREKLENLCISDYHGLQSPGLTCYLNSVLQVLFMTEDFRAALKSSSKGSSIFDRHLGELFEELEQRMTRTHEFIEQLGITDVFEQRDAGEYFEKILCLTSSEASMVFKGELNQKTTCHRCEQKNQSESSFLVLPLAMEDSCGQTYNVERGLEAFFTVQEFSGDNQMYCSRCKEKQHADIEWEMTRSPDVLTLLLKRFTYDYKMKSYVKLRCRARVPQTLYIKKYRYDLYAVVDHCGTLTEGHYTALIQSFENREWYCFDDDFVKITEQPFGAEKSFRSSMAYLLMYRKVRQQPEKTDGSSQEAHCAHSDVQSEAESRDTPLHPLQSESLKHMNGDVLTKSRGRAVRGKQTSGHQNKQPNQRAVWLLPEADAHGESVETPTLQFPETQQGGDLPDPNRQQTAINMRVDSTRYEDDWRKRLKETVSKTGTKTSDGSAARKTVQSLINEREAAASAHRSGSGVNGSPSSPRLTTRSHGPHRMNGSSLKTNRAPPRPIQTVTTGHQTATMTRKVSPPWR